MQDKAIDGLFGVSEAERRSADALEAQLVAERKKQFATQESLNAAREALNSTHSSQAPPGPVPQACQVVPDAGQLNSTQQKSSSKFVPAWTQKGEQREQPGLELVEPGLGLLRRPLDTVNGSTAVGRDLSIFPRRLNSVFVQEPCMCSLRTPTAP